MDVRSGPWRHTCTSPRHPGESKQPYKVARLRFNPKFISSISKGLSRTPSVSERLTRTLPSPTSPRCSPSCLIRFSFPSHHLLLSVSCGSVGMCSPVHRCIASTPLHYDSYIAIFIIFAAHRCPRSRLTSVVSFYPSSFLFLSLSFTRILPSFLANHCRMNSRPLGAARSSRRRRVGIAQWRTHSRRSLRVSVSS